MTRGGGEGDGEGGTNQKFGHTSDLPRWPGASYWATSDLSTWPHTSHWGMPLQPRPFCCPPDMHSVGPSGGHQERSSTLNMGKSLLPPCTRDEPHMSKNVHGTKPGNGAIIAGGLCRVLVRIPVVFRWRGMNGDCGNEIQYRSRLQEVSYSSG